MPERCACCLGHPDAHLEARLTKTIWLIVVSIRRTARLQVPYCAECAKHVKKAAGWRIFLKAIVVFFLSLYVQAFLMIVASWLSPYPSLAVVQTALVLNALLLPFIVTFAYLLWEILRRRQTPGPEHVRFGPAVELTNFTSETLTLDFHNPDFAELVNVVQTAPRVSAPRPPIPGAPPSVTPWVAKAPQPVAREVSSASVRRRLTALPQDANPERVLRFVAHKCENERNGLVITLQDGTSREIPWTECASAYMRRLPFEPPWERMLVMDLVPREGAPVRILSSTTVNFSALPGGAGTSHLENSRRLAAYAAERNPAMSMDQKTRTFVSELGPCAALPGIEQFLRYDDQFADALRGVGAFSS